MHLHYTSPLDLPRVTVDALHTATAASVFVEPPGTERRLLRYAPAFIDDPAGTGLFAGLGQQMYLSPPAFIASIPDATLFGYRALAWEDRFCTDEGWADPALERRFLDTLALPDSFPNEDTRLLGEQGGTIFRLDTEGRPRRHIAETVVSLCSHEPSNYGSFLFRLMPKLHAVQRYGLQGMRFVAWAHTPAFLGILELAGIPPAQVIQHDTHLLTTFDRVIAPGLRNPSAFLDPESHALFQRLAGQAAGVRAGRRLYISRLGQARRGASTRRMTNEAEVVDMVIRLGFEVIEPEALSPAEQIASFASASVIVGPAGSALFNVVFCRPGTKVIDIESEPDWIYAHAGLFASCQTDYGLFLGKVDAADPAPVHRRFSVDVPALQSRLERFAPAR
jgi:hypothetical protein